MPISRNSFLENLNDSPWQANKLEYWSPLFADCPYRSVKKGEIIYNQGEIQSYIYLLRKGRAAVSIIAKDGSERTCMIFNEGTIFGASTAIEGGPSLLTTKANDDCELQYMHRDQFLNKIANDPTLSLQVTYTLSNFVKVLTHLIKDSSFMSAQERVVTYIIKLASIFGEDTNIGRKITLKFTHQQMADLIGSSRVTVSKVMSHLDKEGIVKKIRGYHYVLDEERLNDCINESI